MLFPTLSVTILGLIVAAVSMWRRHTPPVRALAHGLIGAWLGFVLGAVVGGITDVVIGHGWVLVVAGHLTAVIGAVVATSATGDRLRSALLRRNLR